MEQRLLSKLHRFFFFAIGLKSFYFFYLRCIITVWKKQVTEDIILSVCLGFSFLCLSSSSPVFFPAETLFISNPPLYVLYAIQLCTNVGQHILRMRTQN